LYLVVPNLAVCFFNLGTRKDLPDGWNIIDEIWHYSSKLIEKTTCKSWLQLISQYEFVWEYWKQKCDEVSYRLLTGIRMELSERLQSSTFQNDNYFSALFWLWSKLLPFSCGKRICTKKQLQHLVFVTDAFTIVLHPTDMFKICHAEYGGGIPDFLNNCDEYVGSVVGHEGFTVFDDFFLYEVCLLPSLSLPAGSTKLSFFYEMAQFPSFWKIWGAQRIMNFSMSAWIELREILKKRLCKDELSWFYFFFWLLSATSDDKLKFNVRVTSEITVAEPWQAISWSIPTMHFCYFFYEILNLSVSSSESVVIKEVLSFLQSSRLFVNLFRDLYHLQVPGFNKGVVSSYRTNISTIEVILTVLSNFLPFTMLINFNDALFCNKISQSRRLPLSIFLMTFSFSNTFMKGRDDIYRQLENQFGKKNFSLLPKEILRKIIFMKTLNDAFSLFVSMYLGELDYELAAYKEIPEVLSILKWLLRESDVDISRKSRRFHFQHFYFRMSRVLNDNTLDSVDKIGSLCELV
jgi:hypothetical protein